MKANPKPLFEKLEIKQISDLIGRKMEISFFHKLDTSWYFKEVCFLIQSCALDSDDSGRYVYILFPWVSINEKESVRLIIYIIDKEESYSIEFKSPKYADKRVDREIETFDEAQGFKDLSMGKYRLL